MPSSNSVLRMTVRMVKVSTDNKSRTRKMKVIIMAVYRLSPPPYILQSLLWPAFYTVPRTRLHK